MEKQSEEYYMTIAGQLLNELREEQKPDVAKVITDLISQKPSDDNKEQGQTVQLLRGLAFSDDEKATEFMARLMKLIDQETFGDLTESDDEDDDDEEDDED